MCEICLLIEQMSKLNGIDALGSQSGHMPMSSRTNRLLRMLSSIKNAFASIAQFARDTKPSIHSFATEEPLSPTPVSGYTNILNSNESKNSIIDTTNPNFTPIAARRYIDLFCKHTRPGTEACTLDGINVVYFNQMSDYEAVVIARELLRLETQEASYHMRKNG